MKDRVNILGTEYTIKEQSESENKLLADCDGYTDWTVKEIVIQREITGGTLQNMEEYIKKVKRHEIIHAFFLESGLNECSGESSVWARNETMVDWFARQGPKIYKAWREAGAV